MAQKPLKQSAPHRIEIQETDESKNVVATYITSPADRPENKGRIDVIVCLSLEDVWIARGLTDK
jgi:hypothetical protein